MRVGYFGNPEISAKLLERLFSQKGIELVFVISNPDKARRRSVALLPTAVSACILEKKAAGKKTSDLLRFTDLQSVDVLKTIRAYQADIFIVFAYGKILPVSLLSLPPLGAINLHASLLPQLRGATPIQTAILQGLHKTGWTVQYIAKELDAGNIIAQKEIDIQSNQTSEELTEAMLPDGIELLLEVLQQIRTHQIHSHAQNQALATYCHKFTKGDARIDWQASAQETRNFIHAYNPNPAAWTLYEGKKCKIFRVQQVDRFKARQGSSWRKAALGSFGISVDGKALWVQTGSGLLSILELQLENRKRMQAKEFLNGFRKKDLVELQ